MGGAHLAMGDVTEAQIRVDQMDKGLKGDGLWAAVYAKVDSHLASHHGKGRSTAGDKERAAARSCTRVLTEVACACRNGSNSCMETESE